MPGYPPPLPPGRRVDLPRWGSCWVWDSGGGATPVVLLHGWTSTAALTWAPSMGSLARHHRVVAPDLLGHGRGPRSSVFRLDTCAAAVAEVLEQLGTGPAVVVGYSMGGPVALHLWRQAPSMVRGLVLCATAARFSTRLELAPAVTAVGYGLSQLLAAVPGGWRRSALTRLVEARDPDPERARWVISEQARSDPAALVQAAAALGAWDGTAWLGEVDVPAAVIVTTEDVTVPPAHQRLMAAGIPGAEVLEIHAGHRACVEAAGRFVPLLRRAVGSVALRGAPDG